MLNQLANELMTIIQTPESFILFASKIVNLLYKLISFWTPLIGFALLVLTTPIALSLDFLKYKRGENITLLPKILGISLGNLFIVFILPVIDQALQISLSRAFPKKSAAFIKNEFIIASPELEFAKLGLIFIALLTGACLTFLYFKRQNQEEDQNWHDKTWSSVSSVASIPLMVFMLSATLMIAQTVIF